jgi:replicative DNA helicase
MKTTQAPPTAGTFRSGIRGLDRFTGGLHGGDLIAILGQSGKDKTTLALKIAANVALRQKWPVGVICMAPTVDKLIDRLTCLLAKLSPSDLLNSSHLPYWQMCLRRIRRSPLYWTYAKTMTMRQLRYRARRWTLQLDIRLLIVDSLQQLEPTDTDAYARIIRSLKALATKLNIAVIVLGQVPKASKHSVDQSDKHSRMPIFHEADVVGLLVRSEKRPESNKKCRSTKDEATLIIAKNRHGRTGEVRLSI